ncbi:hypothetical protein QSE00_15480 [Arenibacter sp. M-2]|uniref:hypothetical protein n=1 Tax=unclassified Arenibacter TaxID=2615047 RepID=UPI000D77461D|nr:MULTISPECIES: hypothetical protein [unclassified Arenibacter]MDL5513226.1 hypothetical protein [Arenibacter sp. M-2]PXX29969.1 hypothetical protein C7972_103339 [Arenibacter sp. ARW7G5Y1]|tara:strand:- start:31050 stop:31268 length:219 start_codon:yes stop_codon:yes gene_type:complete
MELLIFQTDIKSKKKVKSLKPVLNHHSDIINWSIDLEDIDNVLRIEATSNLLEEEVIDLVKVKGFYIKALSD